MAAPHIRWMILRDLPEVLRIETQSFEFPWSELDFVRTLRQRECIGLVAEAGERILGYTIYELWNDCFHVLNFAVAPEVRRQGVGRALASKLASKLAAQRRRSINLEVRETNVAAQLFFREVGFRATKVIKDWYSESEEDCYLFELRLRSEVAA